MDPVRVLFVDDEPGIRLTLPQILKLHGFEVVAAASVAEALKALNENHFDVLIADLNIGQPGDGFTVVSATRRSQPDAVTIILTGYPAFETALQAIRSQVDDYAVKPADVNELLRSIHDNLQRRTPRRHLATRPLGQLLREKQSSILSEWLELVKSDTELARVSIDDQDRLTYPVQMLIELTEFLELNRDRSNGHDQTSAHAFGRQRREQGYTAAMLLRETCLIRKVIQTTVQAHLLALDMSNAFSDLMLVDKYIDQQMENVLSAFLAEDRIAA